MSLSKMVIENKYAHTLEDGSKETWEQIAYRVTKSVLKAADISMRDQEAKKICQLITSKVVVPGGRILYAAGRPYHQTQNCLLIRAEDSREGWADLLRKTSLALMTGAGVGINYSDIRPEGKKIRKTGGVASGPISLMTIVNEVGRHVMQGGSRRSAIWAGLSWDHSDIHKFIRLKDWSPDVVRLKEKDFNFPASLDMTNISVVLNSDFFAAYQDETHPQHSQAHAIYWAVIEHMCQTGEPGFLVVGEDGEDLRNACCEVSSKDDSDICNLGSINLAKISTVEEMAAAVHAGITLLLANTLYSDVPYPEVDKVRTRNRRIGLGLMGVHEWFLQRGLPYGQVTPELESLMHEYAQSTQIAHALATEWGISKPIATRAIAPTGTISLAADTSSGIEPIFCVAYKRRYLKHKTWCYQYVVDPVAKRLVDVGTDPDSIEDAYDLASNVERRVKFQAWMQQYVDQAISSTVNLPRWGSPENNNATLHDFGNMLLRYLSKLKGITVYPDGARSGQPLTPIKLSTALKYVGEEVVEESVDVCELTGTGTCGS